LKDFAPTFLKLRGWQGYPIWLCEKTLCVNTMIIWKLRVRLFVWFYVQKL